MNNEYQLLNIIDEAVLLVDRNGFCVAANNAAKVFFDRDCSRIAGKCIEELIYNHIEKHGEKQLKELELSKQSGRIEVVLGLPNKTRMAVEITVKQIEIPEDNFSGTAYLLKDITESKQRKEWLKLMENAVEATEVGITLSNADMNIIYTNPAEANMHGYTPSELLGKKSYLLGPPELRKPMSFDEMKNLSGKTRESINVRRDGSRFPVYLNSIAVCNDNGEMIGYVTTCMDVSEQKAAERELALSQERYKLATAAGKAGVWDFDVTTGEFYIDPALKELIGYSDDEIPNELMEWQKYIYEPDLLATINEINQQLICEMNQFTMEHRMIHKDGSLRWFIVRGQPVRDQSGNLLRMVGANTDITDLKLVQEQLRKYQDHLSELVRERTEELIQANAKLQEEITERKRLAEAYRNIVDYSLQGISINQEDRIVFANQALADITGYSIEELKSFGADELYNIIYPEDRSFLLAKIGEQMRNPKKPLRYEVRLIDRLGNTKWLEVITSVFDYRGKAAAQITYLDITERKIAEGRLAEYRDRLRSLASEIALAEERERRRIAAVLHDRISPTLVISRRGLEALAETIVDDEVSERLSAIGGQMQETIELSRSLTHDLGSPVLYTLGLGAGIKWLAENNLGPAGIEFELIGADLNPVLDDDRKVTIYQAARELLFNVVKHSKAKKAEINIATNNGNIELTIADDGEGFDFDPIQEAGAGYGIFSVRERLGYLGGLINIISEQKKGSKVSLSIPANKG